MTPQLRRSNTRPFHPIELTPDLLIVLEMTDHTTSPTGEPDESTLNDDVTPISTPPLNVSPTHGPNDRLYVNSNEDSYLIVPPAWHHRRISPRAAFGAEVRRLLERYLQDRYFLQINPRTRIEQITIDLAEDLEDKENIKTPPDDKGTNPQ